MTDTYVEGELDFEALTAPLRAELTAHCYRMLGSVHDAEDQVQETYLRAWRAYGSFEGRSSIRTWMYTIATRTCLTALEQRQRRPMPTGLGGPPADPSAELRPQNEVPWLEPLPDALVGHGNVTAEADPAGAVVTRESVQLAFIAALQWLTPPQRAVLILRDVLAFSAAETAAALDISVASANSALQRARAKLGPDGLPSDAPSTPLGELGPHERAVLAEYMRAIEQYDTEAVVKLLRDDATWEMPPFEEWYSGATTIVEMIQRQCPAQGPGDMRMVAVGANGQPAAGGYLRDPDGVYRPFQLVVLNLDDDARIRHVSCFFDTALFAKFGLPEILP